MKIVGFLVIVFLILGDLKFWARHVYTLKSILIREDNIQPSRSEDSNELEIALFQTNLLDSRDAMLCHVTPQYAKFL